MGDSDNMPRIRLPERRPLQPLQFNQPKDFTDLIYQTQSQPSALAVGAQTGLQVGTGLAKDYIKKRQDLAQLMALGKKAGLEESTLQDLGRRPETMTAAISALTQKGLAEQLKTPTEREAQGLELEKTRAEIENLRRKKQYAIPQYDTKGNIIGYSELPEGFTPFSGTKPSATPPAGKPKQVGVTPEGKSVVFDPTKQTNIVNGEEYTGTILPVAVGTEEQRRQALVQGAKTSINEIRNSLTPQVLSELKAIRFSPGKVYGQLASREAKMLYINLSEAIANELYLKTGATANPDELERQTLNYMATLNENPADFQMRMDLLERNIDPFSSRGTQKSILQKPQQPKEVTTRGGTKFKITGK